MKTVLQHLPRVTAAAIFASLLHGCDGGPSSPSGFVDVGENNRGILLASGNSVTAGADSSDGQGFRAHLERLLTGQGKVIAVINGGRPGARAGSVQRVIDDVHRYAPAVVTLEYGINDATVDSDTTAPGIVGNLRDMVYAVLDNKSIAVLLTLNPVCGYRTSQNARIQEMNAGFRELAVELAENPAFVLADVAAAFDERDPDGIGCAFISPRSYNHPNDAGYLIIAETVAAALEPLSW